MNERITELIEQHSINITIDGLGYGEGNVEGLAEAIVLECIKVFSKDMPDPISPNYTIGSLVEIVNRTCNVADHFGVEQ
jgi:hypothetical protein